VAVEIGLAASVVLSTDPKPTIDLEIPETVPVNVGDAIGAFNAMSFVFAVMLEVFELTVVVSDVKSAAFAFKSSAA
jgi:hypothetical protein